MSSISEVMQSLPGRFRPKKAGNLNAVIQFCLLGEDGGNWNISIAEGQCLVHEGELPDPNVTVIMQTEDFVGINEGTVSAVDIFWGGGITIEGNIDVVLALPPIMNWT